MHALPPVARGFFAQFLENFEFDQRRNLEKWTRPGIPENAREKEIREARNQVKMTLVVNLVMSCYVMLCL